MTAPIPTPRRVLLTGAGGRIGSAFHRYAGSRYSFRLVDRRELPAGDAAAGHEVRQVDLADLAACRTMCDGIDTVVHLAADPSPRAGFYESLLDNNFKATYNMFQAAKDAGCRRVIFASSVQVFEAYPRDMQAHLTMPHRPQNMYGVSKSFGEAVAAYFAYTEGLSSIAVRIGAYLDPDGLLRHQHERNDALLTAYVSARDLNQLLLRCIEAPPDLRFLIAHGISNNRFKRLDLTSTREALGYAPEDDAYASSPYVSADQA